jgi:hypothetical protein
MHQVFLITAAFGFDDENIRIRNAAELLSSGSLMSSRIIMVQCVDYPNFRTVFVLICVMMQVLLHFGVSRHI